MSSRRMIDSEVTLLPQPDSPTTPSVWPGATEKLMPSTALTTPSARRKWVWRSRTSSRASGARRAAGAGVSGRVAFTGSVQATMQALGARSRVEGVPQAVAHEVDPDHGDRDGHAREERPPPVAPDEVLLRARQRRAPGDVGGPHTEVEEAHEGLEDDGVGHDQRGRHDDRPEGVGQHVPERD